MQNMSGGKTALGLDQNLGAMLCYIANFVCYLGLVYSIIVIVTDKTNKLVRFHAFQSVFLAICAVVLGIAYGVIAAVIAIIAAVVGDWAMLLLPLFMLVMAVIGIGLFVFMIIAAIKAYGGETYKIPVVGNFAEKYA